MTFHDLYYMKDKPRRFPSIYMKLITVNLISNEMRQEELPDLRYNGGYENSHQ